MNIYHWFKRILLNNNHNITKN